MFGDVFGDGGEVASECCAGDECGGFDLWSVGGDAEDDPVLWVDAFGVDLWRELVDALKVSQEGGFGGEAELVCELGDAGDFG